MKIINALGSAAALWPLVHKRSYDEMLYRANDMFARVIEKDRAVAAPDIIRRLTVLGDDVGDMAENLRLWKNSGVTSGIIVIGGRVFSTMLSKSRFFADIFAPSEQGYYFVAKPCQSAAPDANFSNLSFFGHCSFVKSLQDVKEKFMAATGEMGCVASVDKYGGSGVHKSNIAVKSVRLSSSKGEHHAMNLAKGSFANIFMAPGDVIVVKGRASVFRQSILCRPNKSIMRQSGGFHSDDVGLYEQHPTAPAWMADGISIYTFDQGNELVWTEGGTTFRHLRDGSRALCIQAEEDVTLFSTYMMSDFYRGDDHEG